MRHGFLSTTPSPNKWTALFQSPCKNFFCSPFPEIILDFSVSQGSIGSWALHVWFKRQLET
jgi:hypothetical protein